MFFSHRSTLIFRIFFVIVVVVISFGVVLHHGLPLCVVQELDLGKKVPSSSRIVKVPNDRGSTCSTIGTGQRHTVKVEDRVDEKALPGALGSDQSYFYGSAMSDPSKTFCSISEMDELFVITWGCFELRGRKS